MPEPTAAETKADGIVDTFKHGKVGGVPYWLIFVVGVFLLIWWLKKHPTSKGSPFSSNIGNVPKDILIPYAGGNTIINITTPSPAHSHKKHNHPHIIPPPLPGPAPKPKPGPHPIPPVFMNPPHKKRHNHKRRLPPIWSNGRRPPTLRKHHRMRRLPPFGPPKTPTSTFPGSELFNAGNPGIAQLTVSQMQPTVRSPL